MNLLQLYDKLEKLVGMLPSALQKPILHEITPVKNLFLARRAPRLALIGEGGRALLDTLFGANWLDSIRVVPPNAFANEPPDIFLLTAPVDLESASRAVASAPAGVIAIDAGPNLPPMLAERLLANFVSPVEKQALAEAILEALPDNARLEMARISGVRSVQNRIAKALIQSTTAICTAVGTQPIPLADFPILLSLQAALVAAIMYVSGRPLSLRLAGEFLAALGANVGVGIVLREGSRSLLKLLPGWGDAVSGAIAGAGTYAIGKAAAAYFIEGVSLADARRIFKSRRASAPRAGDYPKADLPGRE